MSFKAGSKVTIVKAIEEDDVDFVGMTGVVLSADGEEVIVQFDGHEEDYRFFAEEVALTPELGGSVRITSGVYRGYRGTLIEFGSSCAVVGLHGSAVNVYLLPHEVVATTPYGQGL